jgi:poly-gamma-glutamate capsule biosynthesis protein CapA/YwtB (metallophosphatase superfamily)
MRRLALAVLVLLAGAVPAASQTPPGRSFTIAAAGDIIPHGMLVDAGNAYLSGPGWDFTPMVGDIEPWVASADLAICHMEGTLSATSTGLSGYPRFIGPREMADAIVAAGWDACSTASNHAVDAGWEGVVSTLEVFDSVGIRHAGTARTPEERLPSLYEVEGVTVGHISYTYSTNGLPVPPDAPWSVNVIDADAILADAAWAREHGSEFTIVSLHWGVENQVSPTGSQRSLAETLLASDDVDLILGHHAHVVQPIDRINDKYVVYGMGNHLSNQFSRWGPQYFATEDGLLVRVRVSERDDGSFAVDGIDIVPTWVHYPTYRVLSVTDALLTGAGQQTALETSLQHTLSRALALQPAGVAIAETPWIEVSCEGVRATIVGTPDDDVITGTAGRDVIAARGGDDVIAAGDGDDIVCGGPGDDRLDGDAGRDVVFGGDGRDLLTGDPRDILIGDTGDDRCSAQASLRDCER